MSRFPRTALAALGALTLGCSASHTHALRADASAPPPAESHRLPTLVPPAEPAPSVSDPKAFVARFPTPGMCEAAARRLQATSPDEAWAALKACVELTPFTQLSVLLGRPWSDELLVRPDGADLIARVVAQRGGGVDGELRTLSDHKVPIFSLASAVSRPDTYKGRYVLLRAQVADQREEGERPTVWLVEHALESAPSNQDLGVSYRVDSDRTTSGDVAGRSELTGDGHLGGALSTRERVSHSASVKRYDNLSDETGREALGRLAAPDPFLEPRRDYVILARFDGMRLMAGAASDDEEGTGIPVLTIVSYHLPQSLAVY
ncbi:hypothetical protein DRW03_27160 [Corallococcus sp. H22C18031201]|uniref:hypothetical protein n=1 Tax=Citreicoccus inhibens TaxID=2849499 RepID=UPI000E7250D8|nr:hypothetical protein [Citreicoccus inhibens]MBU8894824.1 hypothetical protein [Citreicoccus inhibens]RJS17671.1 hypothetical protein DRW03_27160 [Corallococcus sp. H22C18031201]